jgi:hypothetical protein
MDGASVDEKRTDNGAAVKSAAATIKPSRLAIPVMLASPFGAMIAHDVSRNLAPHR